MVERYEQYLKSLPVIPDVAARILSVTEEKQDISFRELENIIKTDPALTARILKIANSALYARPREIKSLQTALTLLGLQNIKSLVLLVTASSAFSKYSLQPFYQFFWSHSVLSAFCSRHLAVRSGRKDSAEDCFVAALLHDIGQVALFHAGPQRYQPVVDQLLAGQKAVEELEERLCGLNHRELGAALLSKWSLPDLYVDAAREHESRNITSPHKALILLVSVADLLSEIQRVGAVAEQKQALLLELFPLTGLKGEDLEYYRTRFLADLKGDTLFRECHALFGLKG